jgi:hypothetical protein
MKNQDLSNRKREDFGGGGGLIVRVLPLGGKLLTLWVVLRGTLNITGAIGNGAARFPEHPLVGLFKRIRVRTTKADGSRYPDGLIRDYSPRTILRRAQFFRQKFISDLNGGGCNGAAGAYAVNLAFPIFFAQPDLKRPIETALNCDPTAYSNVQVEIDTGNRDTTFNGNGNAWDFSQLKVDFIDHREAVDGDTYVVVENDHEVYINGANTRMEDKNMPQEGGLLDMLVLGQHGNSGSALVTLADDVLNRVTITGQNCNLDLYRDDIHQFMYDTNMLDPAQAVVGINMISFVSQGMLSKVVPAPGLDIKWDVSNPSGAGLDALLISPRRLFAPAGYTPIQRNVTSAK